MENKQTLTNKQKEGTNWLMTLKNQPMSISGKWEETLSLDSGFQTPSYSYFSQEDEE